MLIEVGTPAYHHPRIATVAQSGLGHNVLQLGLPAVPVSDAETGLSPGSRWKPPGVQSPGVVAPITVRRLDSQGGSLYLDIRSGYPNLRMWRRNVEWNADEIRVEDEVELCGVVPQIIGFRWHLGSPDSVHLSRSGRIWIAKWAECDLAIESAADLSVTQESCFDNSVENREWDDPNPDHLHVCLHVRTAEPAMGVRIGFHAAAGLKS